MYIVLDLNKIAIIDRDGFMKGLSDKEDTWTILITKISAVLAKRI